MQPPSLFTRLESEVAEWRRAGYPCKAHPLIAEILDWQSDVLEDGRVLKFLREPQFFALEVYWYVRLQLNTPHIIDLYKHCFADDNKALFKALGVPLAEGVLHFASVDDILRKIADDDDDFMRDKKIDAVREAIKLDYPSYILALAMGAGKTVLIGAIVATEFAMALRHPRAKFMQNALVFAPGTTIIESLRELTEMPFEKILPPHLHRDFLANLKIEFPGKTKDIRAQTGGVYNLIVSNTEKISLRATRRGKQSAEMFERKEVEANLRLQKIASLPNLGVFSDEAHHTYGNTFDKLKRVRETINYIHANTPLIAVINTTGTPYHKRQPLAEVIVWYGLREGIRDNVLKSLRGGVHRYSIRSQSDEEVFNDIIRKFFAAYGDVTLPDGAKAKIAFYFKSQAHLDGARPLIERALAAVGQSAALILVNTQTSDASEIDDFKRLNNPRHQKRVILLIAKGVEGWNCPSLFACALIKEQTSNNYVLQAATRCLRQVAGNVHPAKIFLDDGNSRALNQQLHENFRDSVWELALYSPSQKRVTLRVRKTELPKLEITRIVRRAVRSGKADAGITLRKPETRPAPPILHRILSPDFDGPREMLTPSGATEALPAPAHYTDSHTAAWKIAARYHLPLLPLRKQLSALYPDGEMPDEHLYGLLQQAEAQQAQYEVREQKVREVLALIRLHDDAGNEVFDKDDDGVYVHRLRLQERTFERLHDGGLLVDKGANTDKHDLSFHYAPYNFDSKPEKDLFTQVLASLDLRRDDVAAFLFTGGLTDTRKTDFHFEYLGVDNRYHRYFPDFVLVKNSGEFYIVEVKGEHERGDPTVQAKAKAVQRLQAMQPEKFQYHLVYTASDEAGMDDLARIEEWRGAPAESSESPRAAAGES